MSEPGAHPDHIHQKIEFSFDDGLKQITEKTKILLNTQDYVVISIAGPLSDDTNVGKTTIGNRVAQELIIQDIPHVVVSDVEQLSNPNNVLLLKHRQEEAGSQKGVVILSASISPSGENSKEAMEKFSLHKDVELKKQADKIGLSLDKIDIKVFIYRADRPITPNDREFADVIINNEGAENKIK